MRSPLLLSLPILSFALTACPSPASLCKSGVDQVCERSFECQPEQVRNSEQFQSAFGTSVENCKAKLYANPGAPQGLQATACDDVQDDAALCANLGQPNATEFVLGEASTCKDERAELSCEAYLAQLSDPSKAPAACARRCK